MSVLFWFLIVPLGLIGLFLKAVGFDDELKRQAENRRNYEAWCKRNRKQPEYPDHDIEGFGSQGLF